MTRTIKDVKRKYSKWLRSLDDNINGVATQRLPDGEEYIAVYVSKLTASTRKSVPDKLEGYPVRLLEIGDIYIE